VESLYCVKVFIITPRFPFPIEKGDKLRIYHQIRHLSGKYELYLVALSDIPVDQEHILHLKQLVKEVHVFRLYRPLIYFRMLYRFFSGVPLQVLYFFHPGIRRKIHRLHARIQPDITYNQLIRTAPYAQGLPGRKVIDYMDAFSTGMDKRLTNSRWPFSWIYRLEKERLIRYEHDVYPFFHQHLLISDQDRDRLQEHVRGGFSVIPNGVDTAYFSPGPAVKQYDLCFTGNMGYRPNVIAAEFLCREILPALLGKYPNLRLVLAGTRPDARVKKLAGPNVTVTGWLPDIRQAYRESGIFVAPIFTGIGQQNKMLEAMAMELPCVCTSSVNHPIGSVDGESVLVADDPEGFVRQIDRLLSDPIQAAMMGKAGRSFVAREYSWETQVNKLIKLFEG
jgi:sugar transferase (PEP-CTERM/EpsH1 system associated)